MKTLPRLAVLFSICALSLATLPNHTHVQAQAKPATDVTWRHDIAPILFSNCTGCHHAGGSGPFPLMTYADAKRFASVIDTATASRYMPPWLPEPGHLALQGDRHLPDEVVAKIHTWIAVGAPEGEGPAPEAPTYTADWQLGPPDLILETASAVAIPASGSDLFTNVILPNTLTSTHWVRAMEIKPGAPQIVHHANVILDRTASLRRTHPLWQQGIPGMDIDVDSGDDFDPDSHFLFWKPDSTALVEAEGMPWRLDAGNDLVLNLHLKPSGKAETTRARIGLYFTDQPAVHHPMLLQLEHDAALDIPAGNADFPVEDALTLPVAVNVLGLYPHAHFLARRMEAWATLPDATRRDLLLIKEWDIDRQSVYRLSEPLPLPVGATLHMRYVYDNSASNIHNPHSPPIRVQHGNRSEDEMAHFWLQVLPVDDTVEAREQLERAWMSARVAKNPADTNALYNLAALDLAKGDSTHAVPLFEQLVALTPPGAKPDARTLTAFGSALQNNGDPAAAEAKFRAALASDPASLDATFDLAALYLQVPELQTDSQAQAASLLKTVVAHRLNDAEAHHLLAQIAAQNKDADGTLTELYTWQSLAPKSPDPHRALAQVLAQIDRLPDAIKEEQQVLTLLPESATDWNDLGVMQARAGNQLDAKEAFTKALTLDPSLTAASANLQKLKPIE